MRVGAFVGSAVEQLGDRRWRPLMLALFILLAGTQVALALAKPEPGQPPGAAFAVAGLVRGIGLVWLSVALLRVATDSARGRWAPDGGFWLYFLLSLLALGASALAAMAGAGLPELTRIFVVQLIAILLVSPLTVWMVAAAVERPLAASPAPWFGRLGEWLPSYLILALIVVVPLASLHARFSILLLDLAGDGARFWGLALLDGVLSTLIVLVTLALRLAAYRSVARD